MTAERTEPGEGRDAGVAPPRRPLPRWLGKLALASFVALLVAAAFFEPYRRTWLRRRPRVPGCAMSARVALIEPERVSGYEPHETTTGQTVWLDRGEDIAVRCALMMSERFPREVAGAFAEIDPERRANALRDLVVSRPADADHDVEAYMAYLYAAGAIQPLPRTPAVRAADDAVEEAFACRFWGNRPCARRPRPPLVAMVLGVPSALGLLATLGVLAWAGVLRARDAVRGRRKRRAAEKRAPAKA